MRSPSSTTKRVQVYPYPVFDDLVELAGLTTGDWILEIGCGTGRATLSLAERGLEIVCVELGERLAVIARRKLAAFPVEVVNATFESWEPARAEFDGVVAFTAFHWIDPGRASRNRRGSSLQTERSPSSTSGEFKAAGFRSVSILRYLWDVTYGPTRTSSGCGRSC